jgi:hypothetical protein
MLSVAKITYRRWYVNAVWVRRVGGMILTQEKWSSRRETHVIAALCTTNIAWAGLGSDLDLFAMIRSLFVN